MTFQHRYGTMYFPAESIKTYGARPESQRYLQTLNQAVSSGNADRVFEAAIWALKHGLTKQFYQGSERVLKLDPRHKGARRVRTLKKRIDRPIPESPTEEEQIRRVLSRGSMSVVRSRHFILLHDTGRTGSGRARNRRAEQRLKLLERTYESFLMLFVANDVSLDIPTERLQVILFGNLTDYQQFANTPTEQESHDVGVWDPDRNITVFYDGANDEVYKTLTKLSEQLQQRIEQARGPRTSQLRSLERNVKTLQLMMRVAHEQSDAEAVTREATFQMAANFGLFPRHVLIPHWAVVGMGAYFEVSKDATRKGIGAVSRQRIDQYQAISNSKLRSNFSTVVSDRIFKVGASPRKRADATAQAWALTHFLMEQHTPELIGYFGLLRQMPPDVTLNSDVLTTLFDRAFGNKTEQLNKQWQTHMTQLQSEVDRQFSSSESTQRN